MTQEKKLLRMACERCGERATDDNCEVQADCPVYKLYELALKKKRIVYKTDTWTIPPSPPPEII